MNISSARAHIVIDLFKSQAILSDTNVRISTVEQET